MPHMITKQITSGSKKWLGTTHGLRDAKTGILKVAAFTVTDNYIKSGTALKLNAQGEYEPSTGGANAVVGHLVNDVMIPAGSTANVAAAVLLHGIVKVAHVPAVAGTAFTKPTAANQITYI